MLLNSFPRPYVCLPLFNLFSLLVISFPIFFLCFFFFCKRENGGVERGPNRGGRTWQASAAIFASSQDVRAARGRDLAHWPIHVQSKELLWPFFFFLLHIPVQHTGADSLLEGWADICRVDVTFPGSGEKKKDVMLRLKKKGCERG